MLDLTGLTPTLGRRSIFPADDKPHAWERMVERALASEHCGERWARHWMNVAGCADSDVSTDADPVRPRSCQFRDCEIRSLNADKPFDPFNRVQPAGDDRVRPPFKILTSRM